LTHIGGGIWTGTWRPVRAADVVGISVTAVLIIAGGANQVGSAQLTGGLRSSPTPTVTAGGVVHGASFAAGTPIAPGSWITVYGSNLADSTNLANVSPLPRELDGVEVLLGNRPLPLRFISATQMNVQVPFDLPVNTQHQITVRRGTLLSVPEALVVAAAQPGVFTRNQQGTGQGAIVKSDGITIADAAAPARIGETVVIYCTGLGAVNPPVPPGEAAPASPLSRVVNPVVVKIGGVQAAVDFAGLTPGAAGLYQINAVVPQGVALGDAVPVILEIAGQTSPVVTMAVR
ncbi:MAG: hypothetical protein ACREN5_08925, partial [Gemmatimonadales bacterium]